MKISSLNYSPINFNSRKENIRRADDLVRHSRNNFPVLSNTYMDLFYNIRNNPLNSDSKKQKVDLYYDKVSNRISKIREHTDKCANKADEEEYKYLLRFMKMLKAGNCEECSDSLVATLAANGYYSSYKYDLALDINFINKNTKESEFSCRHQLDHTFVITTLDKNPAKSNNRIVADSWLCFADSLSGAREKYKKIYAKDIKEALLEKTEDFIHNKNINIDDYEIRTKMVFCPALRDAYDCIQDMGDYCKRKYSNLVLK